jgi:anti-anti-sigma factor
MLEESFRVEIEERDQARVIRPLGELDLATVDELSRAVSSARGRRMVLDLSGLEFIDTSGMRLILAEEADPQSELVLIPGPRAVQRLFEIAGVADRLPFADSIDAALDGDGRGPS